MYSIDKEICEKLSLIDWLSIFKMTNQKGYKFYNDTEFGEIPKTPIEYHQDGKQTNGAITVATQERFLNITEPKFIANGFNKVSTNESGSRYDITYKDVKIEIKMSQSKNAWQGSTHSNKVGRHILLHFEMDDIGYMKSGSVFFLNLHECVNTCYKGECSNNNSRTTFQIWKDDVEKVYPIMGDIIPLTKHKYSKIIHEEFEWM